MTLFSLFRRNPLAGKAKCRSRSSPTWQRPVLEPLEDRCLLSGDLFVANAGDNTIHHFSATGADLGGFSANGSEPAGLAVDHNGNLYVSLYQDNAIRKFSQSGTDLGVFANTGLANPGGMIFDANGNLYVVNYNYPHTGHSYIRKFSSTGTDLGIFASGIDRASFLAIDTSGDVYVDESAIGVRKFSPTGEDMGLFAATRHLNNEGLAFDAGGNLYVGLTDDKIIRKFSPTGADLGVFTNTGLDAPRGIVFGSDGNLYVTNSGNNTIREFSPTGEDLGNFAISGLDQPYDLAFADVTQDNSLKATGTPVRATEGQESTSQVATFTDTNGPLPPEDYTATIDWGDRTVTTGTVDQLPGDLFTVTGDHKYAEEGSYTVSVIIQAPDGRTAGTTSTATVFDAELEAVAHPTTTTEGKTFFGPIASFTDAGGPEAEGNYRAWIIWGDGASSLAQVVLQPDHSFAVFGGHSYSEEGSYTAFVYIRDDGTPSGDGNDFTTTTVDVTVKDAPLAGSGRTLTATTGQAFSGVVADFTDQGGPEPAKNYKATIDWGDGSSSIGTVQLTSGNAFVVSGQHTYDAAGLYHIAATVQDDGNTSTDDGSRITINSSIRVAGALPSANVAAITADGGALPGGASGIFDSVDAAGTISDFPSAINWGEAMSSPDTILESSGNFDVPGSRMHDDLGAFSIASYMTEEGRSHLTADNTTVPRRLKLS